MRNVPLLRRLVLADERYNLRLTSALIALALALYTLGYAVFYPRGATIDDDGLYLEQTRLWVETGSVLTDKIDPLSGERTAFVAGDYPIGMVVLMAPFVKAFGWRGAFLPFGCGAAFVKKLFASSFSLRRNSHAVPRN